METGKYQFVSEIEKVLKEKEKKTSTKYFNIPKDDVPEHVKNYGKYNFNYAYKGEGIRSWF